ncbi:helix-turn-helix domain-containing protein [Actinomadura sp. 3N407]|uniref:helix-turn-helix domain-containing protein n=1 Tax=Actinomadura sp. 3N407 TaxID=3457423 RepID=UPI003FCE207C
MTKLLYTIAETRVLLSLSKTVVYEQLNAGRLRSVHQGRTRLIPATAILEYVALLERESAVDSPAGGPADTEPGQDAPSWSVGSGGGSAPRMDDSFLRVHLWRSTGCHDQSWEL